MTSIRLTSRSFDALLFDLGGVVLEIDFERMFARWARHAGGDPAAIRARFSFDEFYARHERGEISASEYFASLRSSLGIDLSDDQFVDGWGTIYVGEIPGVPELLRSLKDEFPLYAFTNSNPTHMSVCSRAFAETLKHFRRVFVSSDLGVRKPEREAFARIATAIGVPLERILFFDDTAENVRGALAAGLQAVHVDPTHDVAAAIAHRVRDLR
ncbi:MAG TPA: HAD family phosphatase [Candidatus Acidoferrum sp.]|nr:HAD family phosphatase [Candidatus Acidoferrum sp.]